VLVTS